MIVLKIFLQCLLVEVQSLHMKPLVWLNIFSKKCNISGPHGTLPNKCNSGPQ
jgi:hypothetical protein